MVGPPEILRRALAGERRWLARAITRIELRDAQLGVLLSGLEVRRRDKAGAPHVLGLTGPPGAGKSTLANRLVSNARARGERVAVVAVDPSSPFSGGAILGDRVRMEGHTGDSNVYIRSLSSRGHLGGLSISTTEVVDLLDAAGFDRIVVETVGVGQSELGVMEVADTVVVLLTPESGDAVQAMKAGLLEIADVFVVNKADRPGADRLARELERSVHLSQADWLAPVCRASSSQGKGIEAIDAAIDSHLGWCVGAGSSTWSKRRGGARVRMALDLVAEAARARAKGRLTEQIEADLRLGRISPHQAARRMTDAAE